jgi:hypothetical protein
MTGLVQCANLNITSDKRIKKNIQELSPQESLDMLRKMKPVKYQFKDTGKTICGFLAQDIQEILPLSITSNKQVIHNIHEKCHCKGNILTFSTFKTSELSKSDSSLSKSDSSLSKSDSSLSKSHKLKIGKDLVQILEILDETSVKIDKEMEGEVFVYGEEVDDFLSIDQTQLFTVTTSAVQELDKQLQLTTSQLELTNSALILATRQLQEEKQHRQTEFDKLRKELQKEKEQTRSLLERLIRLEKYLIL